MAFLDAVGESINRAACVALGNAAAQGELLNYVLEPLATSGAYNGAAALYANRCGLPLPDSFNPVNNFTGGQCEGFQYTITTTQDFTGVPPRPSGTQGQTNSAIGRISSVQFNVDSGNFNRTTLVIVDSQGSRTILVNPPATDDGVNPSFTYSNFTYAVAKTNGTPDNCGDATPSYPPYSPGDNIVNDNVTIINNEGDTVTIPVVIAFGYATLNVDGTINIPVNVQFTGNATLNGNFNFNYNTGDVQPDVTNPNAPIPSPCSDPGGYVPDPSIPDPPASIPDEPPLDPPTTDPAERERLLKGCIVTTSVLDGNETVLFQEDNPDIYIPAVGYVQFKVRVGDASAWTNDIPVKCLRTFVPCPWDAGAIDVRGTPRFGNEFVVTPVYVTRTFNPTYPPES